MKYRIIDSHCHPQFPQYDSDRDQVIRRSIDKGIGIVCVGTDLQKSREAVDLASKYEGLYASVGLHPNDELDVPYDDAAYEELAIKPKVVAVGEIGLDYFRTPEPEQRLKQKARFLAQLDLARRHALPVIVHCRDAHNDMVAMLHEYAKGLRVVIHSFNGTVAQARTYLDEGYSIGLNAIVTFSPQYADMVRYIPIDRLLLETDAPYLAPAPHRGKRNEPLYIEAVGNSIAKIRNITPDELFTATSQNAVDFFAIKQ